MVASSADAAARRRARPSFVLLAVIATLVFGGACLGLAISGLIGRTSAIWVANAILVYFLLKNPRRDWLWILFCGLAGNFAADLAMGDDMVAAIALTACNAAGVVIIAAPLEYFGLHDDLSRPKPLCFFYALAVGPAPLAAGLLAAVYFHETKGRDFFQAALDWYATDALGYSIVVPMLMTVRLEALRRMFAKDQIAVTLALLSLIAATLVVNYAAREHPIAFLIFPVVILVTFLRGFAGGSIGVLMAAAYLMTPVILGDAHAAVRGSLREQIIIVQLFIAVTGFSVVLVGAALEERRRLEQGLAHAIVRAENSREEAVVARDAAERANRLKSMFLATMSHELRTPLNAIIGFSELIQRQLYGPLGDSRYVEYSSLIQGAGHHLLSLINDVLDMSKIEAGKFELHRQKFDVREIVGDCLDLMRERADRGGVRLCDETPRSPLFIDADRRAMKQILLNLLSNAVKFTPSGGTVSVRALSSDEGVVLEVEDTGIGIPSDQVSRLGNPFVQIRNSAGASHEGTGLGLALVRALAEIHHGKFRIESALQRGTKASVVIPVCGAIEAGPLVAAAG